MKPLFSAIGVIFKRPLVFVYISIITLVFCVVEYYNPVTGVISGLNLKGGISITDSFFTIVSIIMKPLHYPKMFLVLAIAIFAAAIIFAAVMSGYMFAVSNTIERRKRSPGELRQGFRKYFFRMFFLSLFTMIIGLIFIVALIVSLIPAFYIFKSTKEATLVLPSYVPVVLAMLSGLIAFFSIIVFEVYVLFLYPSLFEGEKRPYHNGNAVAGKAFLNMIIPLMFFDAALIIFQIILSRFTATYVMLAINWVFKSIFVSIFISYIFASFRKYRTAEEE
ncbi:MAG: hypothetical protein WC677_06455 [Clostridia bacterium]|jgi:hypothetical protein